MRSIAAALIYFALASLLPAWPAPAQPQQQPRTARPQPQQQPRTARQLFAVRGEIIKIKAQGKGLLLITVRPAAKEFAEVTVLARENSLVGSAAARAEGDLIGLFSDEPPEDEAITAAELAEGDQVSIIYDPQLQNRALEIYLH